MLLCDQDKRYDLEGVTKHLRGAHEASYGIYDHLLHSVYKSLEKKKTATVLCTGLVRVNY